MNRTLRLALRFALSVALPLAAWLPLSEAHAQAPSADRVRVVVHGGSVSAFRRGGYGQWLDAACARVDVDNIAKEKLGASALRARFKDALRSTNRNPKQQETWLIFLGGANSIGLPELTNREIAKTFKLAHDAGFRTMGLTITPWGSEKDVRWRGVSGLEWFERTQKVNDFILGRLTPSEAFGESSNPPSAFEPGQLPEIAIDVWDAALRNRSAELRPRAEAEHGLKGAWAKSRLAGLSGDARDSAQQELITRAAELPRWFLRPELIGSDPVHPNSEGHKQIARAICAKAPATWRCDCGSLDGLVWDEGRRKPVARKR